MQVSAVPSAGIPHKPKIEDPKKIHEAAVQFESLLISNLMKSMRESGGSWLGTEDDATGSSAVEMAEEQFAKALSARGGLGLAKLVEAGLQQQSRTSQKL